MHRASRIHWIVPSNHCTNLDTMLSNQTGYKMHIIFIAFIDFFPISFAQQTLRRRDGFLLHYIYPDTPDRKRECWLNPYNIVYTHIYPIYSVQVRVCVCVSWYFSLHLCRQHIASINRPQWKRCEDERKKSEHFELYKQLKKCDCVCVCAMRRSV